LSQLQSTLNTGEDRWLCTLLLQRGYRVEYSAASDAYTHCPEGFNEFYNQRRRWVPSTMANIMDLLTDYKRTIKINDNISMPYIAYQVSAKPTNAAANQENKQAYREVLMALYINASLYRTEASKS
jgi:cellulose synthase/poly-beta-1,6-N-acetylglucosamine synthase-like glycosyltransferase